MRSRNAFAALVFLAACRSSSSAAPPAPPADGVDAGGPSASGPRTAHFVEGAGCTLDP